MIATPTTERARAPYWLRLLIAALALLHAWWMGLDLDFSVGFCVALLGLPIIGWLTGVD
jgi:hypothetical protein